MPHASIGLLVCCSLAVLCNADTSTASKVDELFSAWDRPDSPGAAIVITSPAQPQVNGGA
jgi:hypothetical protein